MMNYDLLLIDSDETIVDFLRCQEAAFEALCSALPEAVDANRLYRDYLRINDHAWQLHEQGSLSKDELRTYRMKETFRGYNCDIAFCTSYYESRLASEVFFMPNTMPVLYQLKQSCTLVVVTNGLGHVHRARFEKGGISHLFAGIVVSGDKESASYRKPHEEIFRDAHLRFAPTVPKSRILMIGDSEATDIEGGIGYGVDTCLYAPGSELAGGDTRATYRIRDWQELPEIVGMAS